MLKINDLSKKFKNFEVLKSININAESSQIYGLIGSNGCGKTTLLKHIIQVYKQDTGEIFYKGTKIDEISDVIKDFYYVQDDLFFPYQHTLNMLFNYEKLLYKNMSKDKFDKLAKFFNLDKNKNLNRLSKGQKKQAAFVLAIAANPKVLLLDEIVDGLDAVVRRKFWNVLIQDVIEREMTVIVSSHDLKELDNICDKVGIMHQGTIIKEEKLEDIKDNIKRVQFAVDSEFKPIEGESFKVVKTSKIGSVYFCVIKGNVDEFKKALENKYKILVFDELPMNLEEIFITELGGVGYGIEDFIS